MGDCACGQSDTENTTQNVAGEAGLNTLVVTPGWQAAVTTPGSTTTGSTTTGMLPLIAATEPTSTWHAYLTIEGLRTSDHRMMAPDSMVWRELPLPLGICFDDEGGHYGAEIAGRIDRIERQGNRIYAEGVFDVAGEAGAEAARLCTERMMTGVSIDYEVLASELILIGGDDMLEEGVMDGYELVTEARIASATMVRIPAFPQAVIAPMDVPLPDIAPLGEAPVVVPGLIAAAVPAEPPAAWFADPALSRPTGLVVEDSGRVYGHVACWNVCHTGLPGSCVTAPRSASGYSDAMQGRVRTAEGDTLRCGFLTMGTGHAGLRLAADATRAHYDNTGARVARVCFGEDSHGIWCAGAVCPEASDEQVRVLRESPLSGDWRIIGGNHELVAVLAVNAPGFPIAASADLGWLPNEREAARAGFVNGEQVSLVASGMVRRPAPWAADLERLEVRLAARLAVLDSAVRPLMQAARDAVVERMGTL